MATEDPDPSQYLIVSLEQKRKDQTKPYDGKKMVWVPDEKECFLLGNIVSTKGDMVTVEIKGEEVTYQGNRPCSFTRFAAVLFSVQLGHNSEK